MTRTPYGFYIGHDTNNHHVQQLIVARVLCVAVAAPLRPRCSAAHSLTGAASFPYSSFGVGSHTRRFLLSSSTPNENNNTKNVKPTKAPKQKQRRNREKKKKHIN